VLQNGRVRRDSRPEGDSIVRRHPRLVLAVAVLLGMALLIGGAEAVLSLAEGDSIYQVSEYERRYIRLREYSPGTRAVLVPRASHLERAHTLERREYVLESDENGFIRPSAVHEAPDLTIVFLGGSTTECFHMDPEERFPYLAGRLLEERLGLKVNSYNGGVAGSNTLHSIDAFLNKVLPLAPQAVVLMHNANDLTILLYEGSYWNQHWKRSPLVVVRHREGEGKKALPVRLKLVLRTLFPHLQRRVALLRARAGGEPAPEDADEFAHLRGTTLHYDPAFLEREFRGNLVLFVEIARASGVIPVLMTQASRFTDDPDPVIQAEVRRVEDLGVSYPEYRRLFDRFNDVIREVGAENGVPVIELDRKIPPDPGLVYDSIHFTAAGSRRVAEVVADELLPLLR
jgi:lysophospholipase L1-like esterase